MCGGVVFMYQSMYNSHPIMKTDRIIVIVLDGLGVGELPDAASYGDTGANTLEHVVGAIHRPSLPNLQRLGLMRMLPDAECHGDASMPEGRFGKMGEISRGKDSTTGHWEMMGVITRKPFPTYPRGFPKNLIRRLEQRIGTKTLGNIVASGTAIIKDLGAQHLRTGYPIVYTSVDSVFQIAANESVVPLQKLYRICAVARRLLQGRHAMGRVIARPFTGKPGHFRRTPGRRDFTLPPPSPTVLDRIHRGGGRTIGIGKIGDLFSNRGLSRVIHTVGNADGIGKTAQAMRQEKKAKLIFTNLVDTDMLYGHRNDTAGYYRCLREFDRALPTILAALAPNDILFISSDHGCDPTTPGTDHTREYVPLLVTGPALRGNVSLGTRKTLADLGQTVLELLGYPKMKEGQSFARELTGKAWP